MCNFCKGTDGRAHLTKPQWRKHGVVKVCGACWRKAQQAGAAGRTARRRQEAMNRALPKGDRRRRNRWEAGKRAWVAEMERLGFPEFACIPTQALDPGWTEPDPVTEVQAAMAAVLAGEEDEDDGDEWDC